MIIKYIAQQDTSIINAHTHTHNNKEEPYTVFHHTTAPYAHAVPNVKAKVAGSQSSRLLELNVIGREQSDMSATLTAPPALVHLHTAPSHSCASQQ